MMIRRTIRRAVMSFETWRFRKKFPALSVAARAEREAAKRRDTQAIHRARQAKSLAILTALRGAHQ